MWLIFSVVPRLSHLARQEMDQRGWTLEQFGQHAGISTSLAHQIVALGNDNVRAKTFRGIAAAFNMTPADLQRALDDEVAAPSLTDQLARIMRLLPDVPEERLTAIEQHVQLAVQPVPPTKRRTERTLKSPDADLREIDNTPTTKGKRGPLPTGNRKLQQVHRGHDVRVMSLIAVVKALAGPWVNRDFRPAQVAV